MAVPVRIFTRSARLPLTNIIKCVKNMQIAGNNCLVCQRPIIFGSEGTWCIQCHTPLHASCIAPGEVCPKCRTTFIAPSSLFAYSEFCPSCGKAAYRQEACLGCGERTRWDTPAEYQADLRRIHRAARFGVGEGTGFALCGLFLVGGLVPLTPRLLLVLGPCRGWLSLLIPGSVILGLAALGVWCFFMSWVKLWLSVPGMRFR